MDWLTAYKIPFGKAAKAVIDWLVDNAAFFFDTLSSLLAGIINTLLWLLQALPAPTVSYTI